MIDGVGQKGPFQFSMPDLSNLAMAFDFGALLAEADRSREMPQLSQRDFDERDDGLGFHDGSGASDLRSNVGRDAHGERLERQDQRDRSSISDKKRGDETHRKNELASSGREARTVTTDTVQRRGSVSDLSDARRSTLGGEKALGQLSNPMTQLRAQKGAQAQELRMERQGVESMFDGEEAMKQGSDGAKSLKAARSKYLGQLSDGNAPRQGIEKQDFRQALRAMNPQSAEAKLKAAKGEGEKVQKLDVAQDMAMQAALETSAAQQSNQAAVQGASETAQTVVEAAKNAVKAVQVKAGPAPTSAATAGGLADLKAEVDTGDSRSQAAKSKTDTNDAKARFENAMRAMESGDTTVKFADAKLGNVEARISLNGQDLSVRLSVDDTASRQGLMDVLAEIRRELKEARLVQGKIDVSRERERGFQDDSSSNGRDASSERENPTQEQGQTGFSLMV